MSLLNAQDSQFSLNTDGVILYQPLLNNPVPGDPVAQLKKGKGILQPELAALGDCGDAELEKLQTWLKTHIATVLAPLLPLAEEEGVREPVQKISFQLFQNLGIIPRDVLKDPISALEAEDRAALRARKVRLGPVLVFVPALNKPAAVMLRAVLWSLWNDKALPPSIPHEGATSVVVTEEDPNPDYYRAIGYPLYGNRVIRVDMLDRVIGAVYDNSDKGKFQAKHEMAEWLGCSIPDLYTVLEAMGHKKVFDPAEKLEEGQEPEKDDKGMPLLATFKLFRRDERFHKPKDKPEKQAKKQSKPKDKKPQKFDRRKQRKDPVVVSISSKSESQPSHFAALEKLKQSIKTK